MLTDDAAGVAARRAGLLAEARGARGVAQRELGGVEHLTGVQVGEGDLGGGDQELVLAGVVGVILELGQLAGTVHDLAVDDDRRDELGEAAGDMCVQEEVLQRTIERGAGAGEHGEASAGKLGAAVEVQDAGLDTQVPMGLGLKALGGEVAGLAHAATLGVLVLILAHGRDVGRDVGNAGHEVGDLGVEFGTARAEHLDLLVDLANGVLGSLGLVALALLHEDADLLGLGVAGGLQILDLCDDGAALLIEREEALTVPGALTVRHGGVERLRVLANKFDVEHSPSVFTSLIKLSPRAELSRPRRGDSSRGNRDAMHVGAVQVYTGERISPCIPARKQDSAMDQVFNFLFGTRLGVGVLFFAGIVIFGIAAFILEKRTHKMYVDRGPKGDDEDSFWN